ncbi:MAG: cyclic nucleotide-binding domain-containing protein [Acidobacteriota bacterium]
MTVSIELFRNADQVESYAAGFRIFEEGSEGGDRMYGVKEGEVEIFVHGDVVETVRPGGIFGEMSLIDSSRRSATAIARTDCVLVPINTKRFHFLVQQTPMFALQVMKIMADRLRRMDARI